jgi:tetraacyldisaccharide 4'-kinase
VWRFFSFIRRFLPVTRVSIPVVSVGNLAVGGTGKTPLVILLAKQFAPRRIAIISRGYGGDEMQVVRRHLPNALCYEDPNRVRAAKKAVDEGAALIFLDDGFQHRRLYRDFDVVIVRPQDFSDRVMPSGKLREPISSLKRADFVFSNIQPKVTRVVDLKGREVSIRGCKIGIFCGIGHPERFKKTVEALGAEIIFEWFLADHEPVDLNRLKRLSVRHLVCTEKDAVKLPPTDLPIAVVEIEADPSAERAIWQNLVAKITERLNN